MSILLNKLYSYTLCNSDYAIISDDKVSDSPIKECYKLIKSLPSRTIFLLLIFLAGMIILPFFSNYYQSKVVAGTGSFAKLLLITEGIHLVFDNIRLFYLRRVAIRLTLKFVVNEVTRYAMFSKTTAYKYKATDWLNKKMIDAGYTLCQFLDWGMPALINVFSTIISCSFIIIANTPFIVVIISAIIGIVWVFILKPVQNKLTDAMKEHRSLQRTQEDINSLRLPQFMNKDCSKEKIIDSFKEPILYDIKVSDFYIFTYTIVQITMFGMIVFLYLFSKSDSDFAVYLLLTNNIKNAFSSMTDFTNQYARYTNTYKKYSDINDGIEYGEFPEQKPIPEQFTLQEVKICRGDFQIHFNQPLLVNQGWNYLVQGPSASGKSTFIDAFQGFLKGITLECGTHIGSFKNHIVTQLQNIQIIPITNVSICNIFDSDDIPSITTCLKMFFSDRELDRELKRLGENPFHAKLEDLSGGQKTRLFLAQVVFQVIQRDAKILFLDEPEQGQDPSPGQIKCYKALNEFAKSRNLTVFWVSHLWQQQLEMTDIEFNAKIKFHEDGHVVVEYI